MHQHKDNLSLSFTTRYSLLLIILYINVLALVILELPTIKSITLPLSLSTAVRILLSQYFIASVFWFFYIGE